MVIFMGSTVEEAIQNGLEKLDITRMKAHIIVIAREKRGFLGLFGKQPAKVDVEPINETTVTKADQKAVKGVPKAINALNDLVKSVSEETVDLGKVVAAIKKVEEKGEVIPKKVKAEILKNDKKANTILEETGAIQILNGETLKSEETQSTSKENSEFLDSIIQTWDHDIDEVVQKATNYVKNIVDDMDVETSISNSYDRRTINLQIDTNEPGRVIGYHGKVLKSLQLLAQNYLYNQYAKNFYITINVNDYVEHRAEVLQSYAKKLANKALETGQGQETDPMSNNERKIIHRIVSKMDGLTSYSEGDEPNRYVVVDIDSY